MIEGGADVKCTLTPFFFGLGELVDAEAACSSSGTVLVDVCDLASCLEVSSLSIIASAVSFDPALK